MQILPTMTELCGCFMTAIARLLVSEIFEN